MAFLESWAPGAWYLDYIQLADGTRLEPRSSDAEPASYQPIRIALVCKEGSQFPEVVVLIVRILI